MVLAGFETIRERYHTDTDAHSSSGFNLLRYGLADARRG
jgi:hypothetical protein